MNTKRLFALLLVLMMVLVLTPVREVKAEGEGCPICGEVGEFIRATDSFHTYKCTNNQCDIVEYTNLHSGGTATCTQKAKCAICGYEYGERDTENGHDWSAWDHHWEGDNDVTYHHRKCLRDGCGATEAEAHHLDKCIDSSPRFHQLVCYVCSRGGFAYSSEPHSFDNWKDKGDGTCTGTCVCGHEKAEAHDFSVDVPAKEATCTEPGYTAHKACSRCGAKDAAYSAISAGHDWVTDPAKEPTCTEPGLTEGKHCTRCTEKVEQKEIPAKGHTEVVDTAVEPTCTETGLTEGKHCSACGEVLVAQKTVPAKGHTEVVDTAVEPTCTGTGLTEGKHCSACGEVLVAQETVPALGHKYRETDRDILRIYYRCSRCKGRGWRDNSRDENRVPGLLLDEAGTELSYASTVTRSGGNMLLTLTPEAAEGGVSLTLTAKDLEAWQKLGLTQIALYCGDGRLVMDAAQIGPGWFGDLEAIDAYAFTLTPTEEGLQIRVEALTGEERTPAQTLSGLTLERGEQATEITENGTYPS
jgi:hypothetical protein